MREFELFVAHIQTSNVAANVDLVLEKMMEMHELSNVLVHGTNTAPDVSDDSTSVHRRELEDSLFDDLSEDKTKTTSPSKVTTKSMSTASTRSATGARLSELCYNLLRAPTVYITGPMLQFYVHTLCQLGHPEYFPEIFYAYARKPIPLTDSDPVKFSRPWHKMPKYAVPVALAEAALETAILQKNLSLAVAIIDTTVAAPAFRTERLLRQASIPGVIVGSTPLIAYAGADWISRYQNTMDASMAKYTAIAGGLAYIGTLSTIGFVAITTWNDQMQRVVWRPGTHLNQRWLREDERRFFDRLAVSWGFQEKSRWGEEAGVEWKRLRDECGARSMILDKTDLMEGMQ
jgi:hypothetical protein